MSDQSSEKKFLDDIRETLDASVENLNAGIRSRLTQARHQALEAYTDKGGGAALWYRFKLPVAGLTTALLILLATTLFFGGPSRTRVHDNIADVEILVSQDNLKFFDNLDFYVWLAEETENES